MDDELYYAYYEELRAAVEEEVRELEEWLEFEEELRRAGLLLSEERGQQLCHRSLSQLVFR